MGYSCEQLGCSRKSSFALKLYPIYACCNVNLFSQPRARLNETFARDFLPFEKFFPFRSLPGSLAGSPPSHDSAELKKIHPHRSLGRSGRRHSTAGGRNVSRQYVSHFDRNTSTTSEHQVSARRTRGRRRGAGRATLYRNSADARLVMYNDRVHDFLVSRLAMRGAISREHSTHTKGDRPRNVS